MSIKNAWRTVAGVIAAVIAAIFGAATLAPAAPAPPSASVVDFFAAGDSLTLGIRWSPVADDNGAASGYNLVVYDSVSGAARTSSSVLASFDLGAGATTALARVPAPRVGETRLYVVELRAVRRGLMSAPARVILPVKVDDEPPPMPTGLAVDTIVVVGALGSDGSDCRPMVASSFAGIRGDTALFVAPLPGLPLSPYCVAPALVVSIEGRLGDAEYQVPTIYPAGASLPTAAGGHVLVVPESPLLGA